MQGELPDTTTIRAIIDEVKKCSIDGMVVCHKKPKRPEAITRDEVYSRQLSEYDYTVTSAGRWLMHQLLAAYMPHDVAIPNRNQRIEDLKLFSGSVAFKTFYDGPQNCKSIEPAMVAAAAERFAQGDEELRGALEAMFNETPQRHVQLFKKTYLCAEPAAAMRSSGWGR